MYIDGALAGVVDEFDGLKDHLEMEGGKHTMELRAEGYTTACGGHCRCPLDKTRDCQTETMKQVK